MTLKARIGIVLLALIGMLLSTCAFAQQDAQTQQDAPPAKQSKKSKSQTETPPPAPVYTGPKKRLSVMNQDQQGHTAPTGDFMKILKERYGFKDGDDVGLKLNSMLTTALQNTGRFVLVERQNFNDIRGEQDLTKEGQTTSQSGAKKGSILGAQQMVRCTITEFVDDAVKEGGAGAVNLGPLRLGGGSAKKKAKVTVDIKIYDVATSKILYTSSASGNSETKADAGAVSVFGASAVFGKSTNDPIEKATRDAITNAVAFIVEKMEEIPWEGKIALVDKDDDGKAFYVLNRGESDGLKVGDRLMVTSPGKEIIDPDSGERIGRSKDKVLGACKVVWTDKNIAHVEPEDGVVISMGSVLKLK